MSLTPEQEAALAAPGARIAVAAGAGSGKTMMLAEAIWRDVERERIPLERIFVATFNRAAAAHLSRRIQDRFADAADGRGAGRTVLDVSEGWIGTFHSLAGRMAREHPFAAGVDPAFGELDEVEAAALMDEAIDGALPGIAHAGLRRFLASQPSLDPVRDAIRQLHGRLRSGGQEHPRLMVPGRPAHDAAARRARLERACAAAGAHPDLRPAAEDRLRAIEAFVSADGAPPKDLPRNVTRALRPLVDEVNAALAEYVCAVVEPEAYEQLVGFAELFAAVADRYARRKRDLGALDFADLEYAALRVLAAGRYAGHFARAYADEFQDANAIQNALLTALGAARTTVVGDGTQAIYGFRHADAVHFLRLIGDQPLALRTNFRSAPQLLAVLNEWLGEALRDEPSFAPLHPGRDDHDAPAKVELVTVARDGEGKPSREEEAAALADAVTGALADGSRPGEIAVLFRALTQVEPFRAALQARGIPIHMVAGRGFFDHDQVADGLALLRVVENPYDEPALVRVLVSPYLAASDEALVELRRAAGEGGDLWPAIARVPDLAPLCGAIKALRMIRREAGLAGLVEAAIRARDHDLAVLGLDDGARRYANLRRLVRMAASFAEVRGNDLRGFLDRLARMREEGQDPGEAVLVDPDLNAVRLMTIHAAKGQEFPVVILADTALQSPTRSPLVIADPGRPCAIKVRDPLGSFTELLGYRDLLEAAKADEVAEERRLLYVALTRAQDRLIVVGRAGAERTQHGILSAALTPDLAVRRGEALIVPVERPARLEPTRPPAPIAASLPALASSPVVAGHPPRLSFSALATHGRCALRFHLEYELGLRGAATDPIAVPRAGRAGPWRATGVGNVVHAALERHDWTGPAPVRWASATGAGLGLPPSAADELRAERLVADLLAAPLADRIADGRARSEVPFSIEVAGTLLSGAIDLWADEPGGGCLIADWKTHDLAGADPATAMPGYELQRALYGLVALESGCESVELAWLFLDAPDRPQTRVADRAGMTDLRGEITAALAALRAPARPAAAREAQWFCSGCPGLAAFCPVSDAARPQPAGGPIG